MAVDRVPEGTPGCGPDAGISTMDLNGAMLN